MDDSKRIKISGQAVAVDGNDIDTDRIIPARFLRCVTFDGLGEHAFEDDRKQLAEQGQTHPFDDPARDEAEILLVDKNFGCGSSREHAPQALMRWRKGIKAIVGESFAEIFFGNCVALGIPCLTTSHEDMQQLKTVARPEAKVEIDLQAGSVSIGNIRVPASMPAGPRAQLVSGRWDATQELLSAKQAIAERAQSLPYFDW